MCSLSKMGPTREKQKRVKELVPIEFKPGITKIDRIEFAFMKVDTFSNVRSGVQKLHYSARERILNSHSTIIKRNGSERRRDRTS